MLDFAKFKQLSNLSEIAHLKGDQIIEIPRQYTESIGLWSLIDSVANYDSADSIKISNVDGSESTEYHVTRMIGDLANILNFMIIDSVFNIIYTFEDEESLEGYLDQFVSDRITYLKIDDTIAKELIEKTRKDRICQCERDLAMKRYKLKLLQQSIEDLESLKASL